MPGSNAGRILAVLVFAISGCARESTPPHVQMQVSALPHRESPGHLISEQEIEALRRKGLSDPVRQLVKSLQAHPEIISHDGILGGTMGFYDGKEICVLNARTVFARFDDGHIDGSGVFEFTVQSDRTIGWRVLNSRIEGPHD